MGAKNCSRSHVNITKLENSENGLARVVQNQSWPSCFHNDSYFDFTTKRLRLICRSDTTKANRVLRCLEKHLLGIFYGDVRPRLSGISFNVLMESDVNCLIFKADLTAPKTKTCSVEKQLELPIKLNTKSRRPFKKVKLMKCLVRNHDRSIVKSESSSS